MLHIIKPPSFILSHLPGIPLGHTSNLISLLLIHPHKATHPQSAINHIYPIYYNKS